MSASATIRVRPATRDRINRLANEDHVAAPELVDRLVEHEENARLLRAMNDGFDRLRTDVDAWAAFKAESDLWHGADADGL